MWCVVYKRIATATETMGNGWAYGKPSSIGGSKAIIIAFSVREFS
jgi:hypothetical protein